jgi:hypothetical protein
MTSSSCILFHRIVRSFCVMTYDTIISLFILGLVWYSIFVIAKENRINNVEYALDLEHGAVYIEWMGVSSTRAKVHILSEE